MVEQPAIFAPLACGPALEDEDDELEEDVEDSDGELLLDGGAGGVEELLAGAVDDGADTVGPLSPPHAVMPNRVTTPAEATAKRVKEVCITTLFR